MPTKKKKKKQTLQACQIKIMHSTKTLEHVLIILRCMINEHVFMNILSLNKFSNPH